MKTLSILLLGAMLVPAPAAASRLKDVAVLEGVRDNQLLGYGVVVGLNGTGDRRQTVFSVQTLTNMLQRMGISVSPDAIRVMNTAAVMVTANLPPFSRPGSKLDITVSAIGDASNLQGGVLLMTPLRGADGQTYAVAQGPVATGGFVAGGGGTNKVVNHPTVGRAADGAIIERAAPQVNLAGSIRWQLRSPDFTTATRVVAAIEKQFGGGGMAVAENGGTIRVVVPQAYHNREVQFIADMENLSLEVEQRARIILNEKTGTVVMGNEVTIRPTSVLHGGLTVEVQTEFVVSQPNALSSGGSTQVTPNVSVAAGEEKAKALNLTKGATVESLVKSLTGMGATVRDIIAILQALKAGGALDAEIELI